MCLYPKLIKNKKYVSNKKNGGNVPECGDERVKYVAVGCGRCMECTKKKARNWKVRILEELKNDNECLFVTLTFSNDSLIELYNDIKYEIKDGKIPENEVVTRGVRLFLERWRKKYKKSVKHWFITELGHNGTERIHLHGLIWSLDKEEIEKIWKYGGVWFGQYVNEKTVNYIIKYCTKMDLEHKGYTPKILCSKGIGSGYMNSYNAVLNKFNGDKTKEFYRLSNGNKMALPIYYRNKLYNEDERENLWINLLDKNVRFIGGVEVNGDDEELIFNILDSKRDLNKQLGYGDDSKDWDKINYLNKVRFVNKYKRMKDN